MSHLTTAGGITLLASTPPDWIEAVMADFGRFLLDHAAAERKASAMAVSFVVQYPDKLALHLPLIALAREELLHFQQVTRLIHERKLVWERDEKDPYVHQLLQHISNGRQTRLLDRLLMGGVVEARGVERFAIVGEHQTDPEMKNFYQRLSKSEANHAELFPNLAREYFPEEQIMERLDYWLRLEAQIIRSLEIRPALH